MKPKQISRRKQLIIQILCAIIAFLFGYATYALFINDKLLFYVWISFFGAFLIYAIFIEPNLILTTKRALFIKNLPENFKGKKIVHISDIHFGPLFGKRPAAKLVNKVNNLEADFIFITGDFLSVDEPEKIKVLVGELKNLKSKSGIFAVLGNHDYYGNAQFLKDSLVKEGMKFLVNENFALSYDSAPKHITKDGDKLWVVGVDDPYHELDDLDKALIGVPSAAPRLLLAHSPEIIPEAVEKRIDMIFLGHTHGGQARLPGYREITSLSKHLKIYMSGFFKVKDTQFYVNRGIGRVMLPIRFFSPPEVAVFELK